MLTAQIIGNLTKDPEKRTSKSGDEFAKFTIAANRGFGSSRETYYVSCTAYGQRAKFALSYLRKGNPVFADGELSLFTTSEGNGKTVLCLNVNNLESMKQTGSPENDVRDDTGDAPVRSASPIPEGAVDVTAQFLNGDDLPF